MFGKFLKQVAVEATEHVTGVDVDGDGKARGQKAQHSVPQNTRDLARDLAGVVTATPNGPSTTRVDFPVDPPVELSSLTGEKRALFVGINYFGTKSELKGCINDVKNIKKFVIDNFHFKDDTDHLLVLTDDQQDPSKRPTKANLFKAFEWLIRGAVPGMSLFFHYSGHGAYQRDTGPELDEIDGQDETIVPVDYESAGQITDDEIHERLVASLPKGVRLTAIMDCCHSHSVFDLPFTYSVDGSLAITQIDNRKAAMEAALAAGIAFFQGNKALALSKGIEAFTSFKNPQKNNNEAHKRAVLIRSTIADVLQFSGCLDHQTSADANIGGQATGAMSWAFREAYTKYGPDITFSDLLKKIREELNGKFQQIPQLSAGHNVKLNTKFNM